MAERGGGRARELVFLILLILCAFYIIYTGLVTSPWQRCQPTVSVGPLPNGADKEQNTKKIFVDPRKFPESPSVWFHNIFFVESSCALMGFPPLYDKATTEAPPEKQPAPFGGLRMRPREACSIEAAARTNPQRPVYFVHTCPLNVTAMWESAPRYALEVLHIPNVRLWDVRLASLLAQSPLKELLGRGKLRDSHWPVPHAADILRLLLLAWFGGTYLDTDEVLLRSLDTMKNFAAFETPGVVANGVMDFSWDAAGRQVSEECIREMKNYNPKIWAINGPGLITRVLKQRCRFNSKTTSPTPHNCGGFSILPSSSFYPVPFDARDSLFEEKKVSYVFEKINGSYGFHLWNHFTGQKPFNVSSSSMQPYAQIARSACPIVVQSVGDQM